MAFIGSFLKNGKGDHFSYFNPFNQISLLSIGFILRTQTLCIQSRRCVLYFYLGTKICLKAIWERSIYGFKKTKAET